MEQTLVIIKPDGVKRHLIGEIIKRYELAGLVVKNMMMLRAGRELIEKHYPAEDEYLISLGKKSEKAGDVIKDYKAQGLMIVEGLREYLTSSPIVAMLLEGENAILKVRDITGYTDPITAEKGSIRGDFGKDNIQQANAEKRAVQNLIHASGNPEEAEHEINLWFPKKA